MVTGCIGLGPPAGAKGCIGGVPSSWEGALSEFGHSHIQTGYGIIIGALHYFIGADPPPITDEFLLKLNQIAKELDADPRHLLNIMSCESDIRSDIRNPDVRLGTIGLIQFIRSTREALGWPKSTPPFIDGAYHWTPEDNAFASMGMVNQLDFVRAFFLPYRGRMPSAERIYHMTYFPKTLGRGSSPGTVITARDADDPVEARAYAGNSGLDSDKDGLITYADLSRYLAKGRAQSRYKEAVGRLEALVRLPPEVLPASYVHEDDDEFVDDSGIPFHPGEFVALVASLVGLGMAFAKRRGGLR